MESWMDEWLFSGWLDVGRMGRGRAEGDVCKVSAKIHSVV
jgi:hypothetical protein